LALFARAVFVVQAMLRCAEETPAICAAEEVAVPIQSSQTAVAIVKASPQVCLCAMDIAENFGNGHGATEYRVSHLDICR
jgi:hypothetical protein